MEHFILYKNESYQSAFPDIIRVSNGNLALVFREALARPGLGNPDDKWSEKSNHYHADPDTRNVLLLSSDDGVTWNNQRPIIIDESDGTQDLNMPLITEVSSSKLIVVNHRWSFNHTETAFAGKRLCRKLPMGLENPERFHSLVAFDKMYSYESSDSGLTWTEARPILPPSFEYAAFVGKTSVVELSHDLWLMPIYSRFPSQTADAFYVIRSRDQGRTWGDPSLVASDPNGHIQFHEPPILKLRNGRLLTLIRTSGADGYLYQCFSDDGGWTWHTMKRTSIWGLPCHLMLLRDGRILCSYGYRREPFGVRAVLSDDEGETWNMDRELVIRDDGIHSDLGYPASVQLRDDRILTTYYFHGDDGIRFIGASVFGLDE